MMAWLEVLGSGVLLAWLALPLLAWAVRARPEHAPEVVYRRSLAALVLGGACFGLPWLKEAISPLGVGLAPLQVSVRLLASSAGEGRLEAVRGMTLSPFVAVAVAWGLAAAFAALRWTAAWLRLRGMLARASQATAVEHATLDEELAQVVTLRPRLLVSEEAASPFSVGAWRPVIVLPLSIVEVLDDASLRLVLRHELLHLQRRDPLTHALARLCALPFAGHPSLPPLLRQLSLSRELAVDRQAAEEDPRGYARVLLRLAELTRFGADTAPVAMDDTALARRIAILTNGSQPNVAPPFAALSCALAFIVVAALFAPRVVPNLGPSGGARFTGLIGPGEDFIVRGELPFSIAIPAHDPLAAYQEEITDCYELARGRDDSLIIDTLARFTLNPSTFTVVGVDLAVPASRTFERCVAERAKNWSFPPPPGAPPLPAALSPNARPRVAVHIERHP
jgi:hypothetical protein